MEFFRSIPIWKTLWHIGLSLIAVINVCCAASELNTAGIQDRDHFYVGYTILDLNLGDSQGNNTLTVAVWYPTGELPRSYTYGGPTEGKVATNAKPYSQQGPYPLLIFSHGYGGSGLGSVFLTEPLAARGWIVVAPDHHDRHSAVRIGSGQNEQFDRQGFLRHAREISNSGPGDRNKYLYRVDEIKQVLDQILQSKPFRDLIDKDRIAVGGHSFGGYTALGLCGTIDKYRDDRIKGLLLYSTGAGGYLYREKELARVNIPSMYFLGERERNQKRGAKTMAELADKVYRNLPPPKYLLEIKGANHFSFNNRFTHKRSARWLSGTEEQFEVIRRYSIAFLKKHFAEKDGQDGVLKQQDALITRYLKEF
ncbi:MAG: hypothetical protein JRF72_17115 [Deltaproteobacteria bacterium]|jgi:predicted dienelactone hydrolase|nr:hypothetical protein [Deltaproteobacteria bacterium]